MSVQDNQIKLLEAMDKLVQDRIGKFNSPKNQIGIVEINPIGYKCLVKIKGEIIECHLPEHLHTWIQKDDIVMVQDVYGDGTLLMVEYKTGETQELPTIVVYDETLGKNVSGVDMVVDENGNDLGYAGVVKE